MFFLSPLLFSLNLIYLPTQRDSFLRVSKINFQTKYLKENSSVVKKVLKHIDNSYPREQLCSGGIAKLYFNERPDIYINNKKINVFTKKEKNGWVVLLPLSLYKNSKFLRLESKTTTTEQKHKIRLHKTNYEVQHIKLDNKEFVIASKKTLERIWKESALKKRSFSRYSRLYCRDLKMIKPLDSELRHDFGKRRFFNGVAKNPHAGIDLSGKKGDKIKAPLSGEIILLGNLFYNGNMLLIDHGQGLITAYSHLSKISKKEGSWVKQGEIIGEVGATGRATGPHLHWSVYLNGEPINPDLFLEDASL